jgi:hypothetical protein
MRGQGRLLEVLVLLVVFVRHWCTHSYSLVVLLSCCPVVLLSCCPVVLVRTGISYNLPKGLEHMRGVRGSVGIVGIVGCLRTSLVYTFVFLGCGPGMPQTFPWFLHRCTITSHEMVYHVYFYDFSRTVLGNPCMGLFGDFVLFGGGVVWVKRQICTSYNPPFHLFDWGARIVGTAGDTMKAQGSRDPSKTKGIK